MFAKRPSRPSGMHHGLELLVLADHPYSWHSIRQGSAGHDYLCRPDHAHRVQRDLRHKQFTTTLVYLQALRAELLAGAVPEPDPERMRAYRPVHFCSWFGHFGSACTDPVFRGS